MISSFSALYVAAFLRYSASFFSRASFFHGVFTSSISSSSVSAASWYMFSRTTFAW